MDHDLFISADDYGESDELSESIEDYLDQMHGEVSRTFDAALQKLSGDLRREVQVGYLMCRIPDTIEDSDRLSGAEKYDLLNQYRDVLDEPSQRNVGEFVRDVFDALDREQVGGFGDQNSGSNRGGVGEIGSHAYGSEQELRYWDLVKNTHAVTHAFQRFDDEIREYMRDAVDEMSEGMAKYSRRAFENGYQGIRIKDFDELEDYCHYVAGTVGELLTDIFSEHEELPKETEKYSEGFGQFLQTVNILKDPVEDLEEESAVFIPEEALEPGQNHRDLVQSLRNRDPERLNQPIHELIERAETKSEDAKRYIETVPENSEIRGYVEVPFLLAEATLREAKEEPGKMVEEELSIDREEVFEILKQSGENNLAQNIEKIEERPLHST